MKQASESPLEHGVGAEPISVETVCCGCRPRAQRDKERKFHKLSASMRSFARNRLGRSQFFDAPQGDADEFFDKGDDLFFFDAEMDALADDEYPIVFTTSVQKPKHVVTFDEPESLLKSIPPEDHKLPSKAKSYVRSESEPIQSFQRPSQRFLTIARRPSEEMKQLLVEPRIKVPSKGYPGELTVLELAECQKFLRGLKQLDSGVAEQIYSFRNVEEEPYTICRWLRATKFDADAILARCAENQPMFEEAKSNDFYPDVSEAIGAPFSVFLSQYPFLPVGRGKNGSPVNYFQAGRINPEGIMTMTSAEKLRGYFWWSFMYKFKQEIRKAKELNEDFVRCEGINVIDLSGLSASALSAETMEVIRITSKISDFFPETLHCMLILNAPSFFSMSWGLIKKFIDPRTAQRIQVFSSKEKGLRALNALVSQDQIPSDYGGSNISLKDAFRDEANDPALLKQEIELLHAKKRSVASTKRSWEIGSQQYMDLRVYTRSSSGGLVKVKLNGKEHLSVDIQGSLGSDDEAPSAVHKSLAEDLVGPGTVEVEVADMDNADKKNHKHSRGYFLIVGDIKTLV